MTVDLFFLPLNVIASPTSILHNTALIIFFGAKCNSERRTDSSKMVHGAWDRKIRAGFFEKAIYPNELFVGIEAVRGMAWKKGEGSFELSVRHNELSVWFKPSPFFSSPNCCPNFLSPNSLPIFIAPIFQGIYFGGSLSIFVDKGAEANKDAFHVSVKDLLVQTAYLFGITFHFFYTATSIGFLNSSLP